MGRKHDLRDRCTKREMPDLRGCPLRVREGYYDAPFMTTIRKLLFDKMPEMLIIWILSITTTKLV